MPAKGHRKSGRTRAERALREAAAGPVPDAVPGGGDGRYPDREGHEDRPAADAADAAMSNQRTRAVQRDEAARRKRSGRPGQVATATRPAIPAQRRPASARSANGRPVPPAARSAPPASRSVPPASRSVPPASRSVPPASRPPAVVPEAGTAPARGVRAVLRTYRPFAPVFAGVFLSLLTVGATLGTLPFYVDQRLHGGRLAVGVVVAAIAVTSILARPTAGRLGDRHGYKRVMLAGALFCALAGAGYLAVDRLPALPGPPVAALVAVRLLHGVGEATVCTGGVAWLVSLSPPQRRGRIVGLYGVYMWLGITVGSAVGTLLMRGYGFTAAWLFCVAAPLAGLLVVAAKRRPVQQAAAGRAALFPRVVWLPGTAMALGGLGYAALAGFGALYLDGRGIANGIAVFEAFGVTYIGVRLLLGNLPDRLGGVRVALWSGLVEAVGLALVAYAPNLAVALLGGVVMGAGLSLLFPALALLVIRRTPAARQGGALGAFTSFWDLGLAAGPPLTGAVANRASYPVAFLVMAGAAVLSALLALVHGRRHPATAPPVPVGAGTGTTAGAAQTGAARNGAARNGAARNGAARNGAARNGAARNGPARNGRPAAEPGVPARARVPAKPPAATTEAPAGGRRRSRKQRKRSARRRSRG